ncbi:MAG: hypothetical protein PUF12_06910 [Thermoflexaceae bacterium]|nr:hypothetical protein [Thermoflexaceae bacterium]
MEIRFDKLYRYDRLSEHCSIAIPVKESELYNLDEVQILDGESLLPVQKKVTSRYKDGSVRYMFLRFMADLPANNRKVFQCDFHNKQQQLYEGISITKEKDGFLVDCKGLQFAVQDDSTNLFTYLNDGNKEYTAEQFVGPVLTTGGEEYGVRFGQWDVVEDGPLCAILRNQGKCTGSRNISFECMITAYSEKKWLEVSYRLINTTDEELHVESLVFCVKSSEKAVFCPVVERKDTGAKADSTGCGDAPTDNTENFGPFFYTNGIKELSMIEERIGTESVRTCVGRSNYKTGFQIGKDGLPVSDVIDSSLLVSEANEHFAEVMYGTFFTDVTDQKGGVCATVFQAQQNYPKAVMADESGIYVMLVPKDVDRVAMASGMSREQKFLLHFHDRKESLIEIDNRSLIYQMPDRPHIAPECFKEAGVMPDIFVDRDKINYDVEISLVGKADGHARCYGMMNWGDAPDPGYTSQGRGRGRLVWTNNEYDYPHAMYLMYAKTGTRRFFDYATVAASHWMDVDVCHYSNNPLRIGGQWEHTMGHCGEGLMVCSHEWVEGLLDCYHFTGNERALQTALGIGENVLKLLETPMYQKSGESNARETGWALRTLVALYVETWDDKWTTKCKWIIGHFKEWTEEYGEWLAPYTDNTTIRVGFMISVAVGSLMRYYRIFKDEEVKAMIMKAIDDLVDNCLMDNGLFYYKELPSLCRNGKNTLLLEAMTIGYELTGDTKYLEYGRKTFYANINEPDPGIGGAKKIVEDTVISGSKGTKNFGQCFIPLSVYYKAMTDNNML